MKGSLLRNPVGSSPRALTLDNLGTPESTEDQRSGTGLQPALIESSPNSPRGTAGQEKPGKRPTHSSVRRLCFEGEFVPDCPRSEQLEAHGTMKGEVKGQEEDFPKDSLMCPLTIDDSFRHVDTPLHAVPAAVSWKDEPHPSWVKIRTVMDSGAAPSVAPPSMAPWGDNRRVPWVTEGPALDLRDRRKTPKHGSANAEGPDERG